MIRHLTLDFDAKSQKQPLEKYFAFPAVEMMSNQLAGHSHAFLRAIVLSYFYQQISYDIYLIIYKRKRQSALFQLRQTGKLLQNVVFKIQRDKQICLNFSKISNFEKKTYFFFLKKRENFDNSKKKKKTSTGIYVLFYFIFLVDGSKFRIYLKISFFLTYYKFSFLQF